MRTLLLVSLLFASLCAHAAEDPYPFTGTYSDLRCIEEEGDVVGAEITILASFEDVSYRYYAIIQFAEGVAGLPQLVPVELEGNNFSFKANYLGQLGVEFSGTISKAGLSGRFAKPLDITIDLPRKRSFWDAPGDLCV